MNTSQQIFEVANEIIETNSAITLEQTQDNFNENILLTQYSTSKFGNKLEGSQLFVNNLTQAETSLNNSNDMILTQCVSQDAQLILSCNANMTCDPKDDSASCDLIQQNKAVQCDLPYMKDVATQTENFFCEDEENNELYFKHPMENKKKVIVRIEDVLYAVKPRKTIRIGLSKKWKPKKKLHN